MYASHLIQLYDVGMVQHIVKGFAVDYGVVPYILLPFFRQGLTLFKLISKQGRGGIEPRSFPLSWLAVGKAFSLFQYKGRVYFIC